MTPRAPPDAETDPAQLTGCSLGRPGLGEKQRCSGWVLKLNGLCFSSLETRNYF